MLLRIIMLWLQNICIVYHTNIINVKVVKRVSEYVCCFFTQKLLNRFVIELSFLFVYCVAYNPKSSFPLVGYRIRILIGCRRLCSHTRVIIGCRPRSKLVPILSTLRDLYTLSAKQIFSVAYLYNHLEFCPKEHLFPVLVWSILWGWYLFPLLRITKRAYYKNTTAALFYFILNIQSTHFI